MLTQLFAARFFDFINVSKPIYVGTNEKDKKQVEVELIKWHKKHNFGSANIKPYLFSHCWGEKASGKICFDFLVREKTLSFVEDSYAEREQMAVMVSEDFKILKFGMLIIKTLQES